MSTGVLVTVEPAVPQDKGRSPDCTACVTSLMQTIPPVDSQVPLTVAPGDLRHSSGLRDTSFKVKTKHSHLKLTPNRRVFHEVDALGFSNVIASVH